MAVPGSGAIDLKDLQDEFGGSNPISISEYYRNGGLVPSNNTDVPTSGTVKLSDFYGAVNEIGVTASAASSANLQTLFNNATANSWTSAVPKRYTINGGTNMGILTVPASMGGTLIVQIASGATVRGVGGSAGSGGSAGGAGSAGSAGSAGGAGATAMSVASTGVTVNVVGSLQGGGGGAGGGGGGGGGGQGRTSANTGNYYCGPTNCGNNCAGGFCQNRTGNPCCNESNDGYCFTRFKDCWQYTYYTGGAGGAGGAGGKGQGYVSGNANGASGSGGSSASNAGTGGTGGAGGNGAAYGAAGPTGAAGSAGANSVATNGGGGGAAGAAGAAGRAITFVGISAYTIIGTSSGTISGAYT